MWSWITGAEEVTQALSARLTAIVKEAEHLSEEAIGLALRVWDQLDALPVVPSAFKIPPIERQLYAHGAFMGAAPALLGDEQWRRILAFLMPDVYADVTAALEGGKRPEDVITMFENNPVMAAFGCWRSAQGSRSEWALDQVGIEWDLFIDGDLAVAYDEATPEEQAVMMEGLMSSAVIAHAAALDTLQENLGFCQHADVRRTRKSRLGGVEIYAWLDLFARALRLASADDPAPLLLQMAAAERHHEGDACLVDTFLHPIAPREAIQTFREVTGRKRFSVVLDMKSLRSTPLLFSDLIRALNALDVHVAAACSFALDEIEGLSQVEQVVAGETLPGPREVLFFHYAGDLQRACDTATVPAGMSVLFNGASLLGVDSWFSKDPKYHLLDKVIADLARYQRRHGLQIGLYVQEGDCDSAAVGLLGQLVLDHPETFTLGFAWGGLRGEVAIAPGDEPRMGHGSQLALAFIGKARAWSLSGDEE